MRLHTRLWRDSIWAFLIATSLLLFTLAAPPTARGASSRCRVDVREDRPATSLHQLRQRLSLRGRELREQRAQLTAWQSRKDAGRPVMLIAVPSLNLPPAEIAGIKGIELYEHRGLWNVLRTLRDPQLHVLLITSQPVPATALAHLFEGLSPRELTGIQNRIHYLPLNRPGMEYLSDKIQSSPQVLRQIRNLVRQALGEDLSAQNTVLHGFISETSLALLGQTLGIAVTGMHEALTYLNSKSGNREIAVEAHIPFPSGFNNLRSLESIAQAVDQLFISAQGQGSAWLKTNYGTSGEGIIQIKFKELNLTLDQDPALRQHKIRRHLETLEQRGKTWDSLFARIRTDGAVIELGVTHQQAPSVQLQINGNGKIDVLSTHMQILDGPTYKGSRQPSYDDPQVVQRLTDYAVAYASTLARYGVVGRIALDFFEVRHSNGDVDFVFGEANIREGGTTHPRETVAILANAVYDPARGGLVSRTTGRKLYYVMTDNFVRESLKGQNLENLWARFTQHPEYRQLAFDPKLDRGVKFHMLAAIPAVGKVGLTAFGSSPAEAQRLFDRAESLLEQIALENARRTQ